METIIKTVRNRLKARLAHGARLQHDEDELWEVEKKKLGIVEVCALENGDGSHFRPVSNHEIMQIDRRYFDAVLLARSNP